MTTTPSGASRGFLGSVAAVIALPILGFVPTVSPGATMSASSTAPVVDDEDIANYGAVSGTDKWFTGTSADSAAKGQTFTTGGAALRLKSISYQVSDTQKAEPTKTYAIRVGKVAGTTFDVVHSETATQSFTWNSDEFMTWTFDTPVLLEPFTTYGIDVGMLTSTSAWQTGIPYLKVTGDDFSGGSRYTSGVSGTGDTSVGIAISADRIFHLDIEPPLGPVFELVSASPADDATDALASREIVLTFSQDVSPGSGNIRIRDLTTPGSPVETAIPASDPSLTYDQNVVRIDPSGLLDWDKDYAIQIDAGTILGDGGAPIDAITDDVTLNFSTLPGDPLLDAIAAIKDHVTGAATLTGPEIAAQKTIIDDLRQRCGESTATIGAVFDLISTYDATFGPLFVSGSFVTDFSRNNTNPADKKSVSSENVHWVVYSVMQHAMDVIYTAPVLAAHEAELDGYSFGSHADFPGPCAPPANPANTHNIQIDGSFPITFGRNTQAWTNPARKPTGTYLAPGTIASVTVPPELVNAGYKVRVGAHSWDLSGRAPVQRLERESRLYPIDATTIKVANPFGGGIYVEVPIGADAGVVTVTVTGGVRSPYFSAKSFHSTTPAEWDVERTHVAPWADFQSDKFMIQVPTKWIYNMTGTQAVQLMADWDAAMDAINDLMGFPRDRGKETMYCQPDVILRSSVHAPGYPAVNVTTNPNSEVSPLGYAGSYLVRGPGANPTASHVEFHEQGHAYGFPKFGGESESNVNLLQAAMLNRAFGYDIDTSHRGSLGFGNTYRTLDNTAVAWMLSFAFSPREVPMNSGEKSYQLKGHAKFMDIARLFGWEGLDDYWRSFMEDDANGIPYGTSDDDKMLRLSHHVGYDIRPLFHFWGIHPANPEALAAAIAADPAIQPSVAIRNLLLDYKALVPADNAAFQTWAFNWWGKIPSPSAYWTETEHARQWDQSDYYTAWGRTQQRVGVTINEEYIPACADEVRDRVQELVDLYYPSAITPNPMTFKIAPGAVDGATVGMVATTATADVGPIEYYFENTTNGNFRDWSTSPNWDNTGLTTGTPYDYRVKARDGLGNETDWSTVETGTPGSDVTAPAPDPMSFASAPSTVDESSITMTASTALDVNGVEYYFECTLGGGNDSGWQASPTFTDVGLSPDTEYGYRVQARDGVGNLTGWSDPATANTADIPDTTAPEVLTFSPANGSTTFDPATDLVAVFDEDVVASTGLITIKNLTDATEVLVDISDPSVSIVGDTLTIDPAADLIIGKTYAVWIDAGSVVDASSNPFVGIADDSTWSFSVATADPIADAGGPYELSVGETLSLDGGASIPSNGQTITAYDWDLNNDGTFGDVTGAAPAAIDYATLTGTYGMFEGLNTIQLRVTDSSAKTSAVSTTVALVQTATYTGPNSTGGQNTWNTAGNWDIAVVPAGFVRAVVPSGAYVVAWDDATPAYTGNLTMESNSTIQIGWTTNRPNSYNAVGTPGQTTITMGDGALVKGRTQTDVTVPEIELLGDATFSAGESTQTPANFTFANPITGAHRFTLRSNTSTGNHSFDAANTFSELVVDTIQGRGGNAGTVTGSVAGAFGSGVVTLSPAEPAGRCHLLEFDVTGVMAATGTLNIFGNGPNGTSNASLRMDADNTVQFLNKEGFAYPAGTYGRVGSPGAPDNEVSWIEGDAVLTVTGAPADVVVNPPAITDPISGITTNLYVGGTVLYTLTFDEVVNSAVTVADFENATGGGATFTIDSVTQTGVNEFEVVATVTGTGDFTLGAAASASFDDLFGNTLNGPFADDTTFTVLAGSPPNITMTANAGGSDSWNTGANWDSGFPPFGTYPATIATGIAAQVQNGSTFPYSGGLTMESGSSLRINSVSGSENALGTGTIGMEDATIQDETGYTTTYPALDLTGANEVRSQSNTTHGRTRLFSGPITGGGSLSFLVDNRAILRFAQSNSFTGGLVFNAEDRHLVEFEAAGSAGAGDVTVNPRSNADNRGAILKLEASDVFADSATLTLDSQGNANSGWPSGTYNGILL
ncbi:Ig-like domain-containing protein, partial [Haloferula helveola]